MKRSNCSRCLRYDVFQVFSIMLLLAAFVESVNLNESAAVVVVPSSTLEISPTKSNSSDVIVETEEDAMEAEESNSNHSSSTVDPGIKDFEMETTIATDDLSALGTDISNSSLSSTADRKCTQKDSAGLNKCLQQVLKELRPRLAAGIPEINLPPMEPLQLANAAFDQGNGPVKIVSHFSNVEVSGLSNFSQSDFWVDVPKRTMDFDLIFPQLTIVGIYELSGNLFFIPVGGSGNFYLNLGGTRAKGVSKLSVFRNTTMAQVVVKKTDVNLEIETIKVHLTNLFNGDPLLGTFINNFLNENSQEVFAEVKPQIGAQVGEMLSLLANRALSALSTSEFDEVPFRPNPSDQDDLSV